MKANKNLLAIIAAVICCVAAVWLSASIQGGEKTYEVQPWITIPEYRTDAARAIDAYERLMERYMDLTESSLIRIDTDVQDIVKRLNSIDAKLTKLSAAVARIEKALGIEQLKLPAQRKPQPEAANKRTPEKSSPPL